MPGEPSRPYDYLVVGSGFGGAVSALRLAEKGWRVAVIEQGREIGPEEISAGKRSLRRLLWAPALGLRGYFVQHMFKHLSIIGGVGVGGGSIVWGAVMLEPTEGFYASPAVRALDVDLKTELAPHFVTARRMLGVATNPRLTVQDRFLRQTAVAMGATDTFGPTPNAIFFGPLGQTVPDPYFDGKGPAREGCRFCGGCLTGCPYGAKNSLYFNYLYFARRLGVDVIACRKADRIGRRPDGGFDVDLVDPANGRLIETVSAGKVVVSAGVVGTMELLFRNRDVHRTLTGVSDTLGRKIRTNSEAVTAVLHPPGADMSDGVAISSHFHPDGVTHATQNRFDRGFGFMRYMLGPLTDGEVPRQRALATLAAMLRRPGPLLKNLLARNWPQRISVFTVMQSVEKTVSLRPAPQRFPLRLGVASQVEPGELPPSYLPVANRLTRTFAEISGGIPLNFLNESLGGLSTTAHVLSGSPMGGSSQDSVIDTRHEIHDEPGVFIVDGSSIPANIGVNPSLTITAMAERFAALQPDAPSAAGVGDGASRPVGAGAAT